MCSCDCSFYRALITAGNFLQPYFLLAIRLFWGWQFFKAGFGKFADISAIAGFFGNLGIPFPLISAYLAAGTEMIGGLLLLIGFASRLVAIPLIFTMLVALFTAHYALASNIFDDPVKFVSAGPFTFLFAALTVFVFGPGKLSVDGLIKHRKERE